MPNIFRNVKQDSVKKMNGLTPQWFKDWHSAEFMEIKLRVTGLLWLVGMLFVAAAGCFAVMLANYLHT